MASKFIITSFWVLLFLLPQLCRSIPLSTDSRWIVDQQGRRVKLTCTNWVTHNEPMVAEGLEKKPVSYIVRMIRLTGFNCVRFTWPTYMFTRPGYRNLTVADSLDRLSLPEAKAGFEINNPLFLNMTVVEAHKAVVDQLGLAGIMVVIDNHVSYPKWCCSNDDGNGFFGDEFFDPDEWVKGLTTVARRYHSHPAVIGMSLRNELRGNRQNPIDWYKFMAEGATAVHRESPNFLVIVSGLFFDTKLNFLQSNPLDVGNLNKKLVYEGHWYSFGYPQEQWTNQTNSLCAEVSRNARDNFLFLTTGKNPFPVFLSEFGIDQRGVNERDNRYISCLLATVAEFDVDWALWTLQGSYIFRQNQSNMEEAYGVMDFNWDKPRNPSFLARLQMIRQTNQGPGMNGPKNYRIFHPQTGLCVSVGRIGIFLGECTQGSIWRQNGGEITLANTGLCLSAAEDGAVRVLSNCKTKWVQASSSKLQLAVDGGNLCLEGSEFRSGVVVNKCLCLDKNLADLETCSENPQTQWFKLVPVQIGRSF